MRVVNVFAVEWRRGQDATGIGSGPPRWGQCSARPESARLYEAREGAPIWPYHYHYPDEEWLYVLGGAPVLRDVAGRRVLDAGDVVCFAAGHRGAHTLEGPGRFIIFSGERSSGVYPDSDKVSVSPGIEAAGLNALRLIRASSVDYWHGEGTGGSVPPAAVRREPESVPRPPRLNARDLTF